MTAATSHNLLRTRSGSEARVEFVELFFDLVFVFAVTQLSHRLIEHPEPRGAVETLVLFIAIWWSWINTAWVTNWLDPHRTRVRLLLFALMALGLVASMSIPKAFDERAWIFAAAYVAMELGRSLFTMLAMHRHDRANALNFARILFWQAIAGAFWIGGAIANADLRLWLWAAAVLVWSIAPIIYFPVPGLGRSAAEDWTIDPRHLAERCGLFIILALGESILVMGASFAEHDWTGATLAMFGAALAAVVAMWWLYFNIGSVRAAQSFAASSQPGRMARLAYTYFHIPIVGGIVVVAAAVEWVSAHPLDRVEIHVAAATVAGPVLYLVGNAAFKRVTGSRYVPLSHLVGLGLLAALAIAHSWLEARWFGFGVAAILVLVAVWETISLRKLHRAHADGAH